MANAGHAPCMLKGDQGPDAVCHTYALSLAVHHRIEHMKLEAKESST